MRKAVFKYVILFLFVIISTLLIYNQTFFYDEYKTEEATIPIPLFSYYKRMGGMYVVTLYSLRSNQAINKVKDNYLNKLEEMTCHGNKYYYDEDQDITIFSYSVNAKYLFLKTINIGYYYGKDC